MTVEEDTFGIMTAVEEAQDKNDDNEGAGRLWGKWGHDMMTENYNDRQ